MRQLSLLIIILCFSGIISAQDDNYEFNPLDYWEGKWILKNTSIDPAPANDLWKSEFGLNEFIPILDGKGLHRIAKSGVQRNEAYMFFDKATSRIYVMSIDPNGYVWESSAGVEEDKDLIIFVGSAKNDSSVSTQSILNIQNENEVTFKQSIYKDGKVISVYEGIWMRIPELD